MFLRDRISQHFKAAGIPINMKYIDPSYIIRSVPANSDDSLLCDAMARHAVHAAMAGKTDVLIGMEHGRSCTFRFARPWRGRSSFRPRASSGCG